MKEYKGRLSVHHDQRVAIVVSRFNEMITKSLLSGAIETLERCGMTRNHITIAWVPGAYESPLIAKQLAETNRYQAVICLGAVIRGATAHFDYVAGQSASGIMQTAIKTNCPVIFGVLTTDTIEQAIERSGTKAGNKGSEAALAAIEMMDLISQIQQDHPSNDVQMFNAKEAELLSL